MRTLLAFFLKSSSWLLFLFYVVVSCIMLFTANPFQHHVYLTSAGAVASTVYSATNQVSGYFGLRTINDDLQRRNAALEEEVLALRSRLADFELLMGGDTIVPTQELSRYSFVLASVINNSTARSHNYVTINRGEADGIRPEMGVVDHNGIVGIVNVVGTHTARIISVLNPYLRLSCKVKGSELIGSLVWDGERSDEVVLEELPRHAVFHKGDTIVTSGFSSAFPEGVPVGTVLSAHREHDDNFYALRIKLFTDFNRLSTVRVVSDSLAAELKAVEKDITPASGVRKLTQ